MTTLLRIAASAAVFAGLGVTAAAAQTAVSRPAPQGYEAVYAGRSVYQAPVAPEEGQIVMGLRVPGSGPVERAPWTVGR